MIVFDNKPGYSTSSYICANLRSIINLTNSFPLLMNSYKIMKLLKINPIVVKNKKKDSNELFIKITFFLFTILILVDKTETIENNIIENNINTALSTIEFIVYKEKLLLIMYTAVHKNTNKKLGLVKFFL